MIINYNGQNYNCSDDYSFKDFTSTVYFRENLSNIVIYASCFICEKPDHPLFQGTLTNVTFIKCNLDNVLIPQGAILIDCTQRRFLVQNDLRDWEVDGDNVPIKVINEKFWIQQGFSVNPADIPNKPLNKLDEIVRA